MLKMANSICSKGAFDKKRGHFFSWLPSTSSSLNTASVKILYQVKRSGFSQALEIMENLENLKKKSSMHGKIMEFENTVKTLYNVIRYNRISNIRHKIAGNGSVSIKIPS